MTEPLRVVHAPTAIGGQPGGLARAERELGLDSIAISLFPHPFGHEVDEVLGREGDPLPRRYLNRARLLGRLCSADAVHFNFGETVLPVPVEGRGAMTFVADALALRDLPLLRALGKRIVVTFQGDDARQACIGGRLIEAIPERYSPERDAARRQTIAAFNRYAHAIFFLNPDLAAVLPDRASFLQYASVDPREWTVHPESEVGPPIIVHAPSDPRVKGTSAVTRAIENLKADGVALRFELLQGISQAEVRAALERCAVVVDQLNAGWYGALAVEAMALGKPVLAAMTHLGSACVPEQMRQESPIVDVSAESLADRLRTLLASSERRRQLGFAGRSFVECWHDPLRIARHVVKAYESDGG